MKTREEVVSEVIATTSADEYPPVTAAEVTRIVDASSRAVPYVTAMTAPFGTAVYVTTNGRMYRAVVGGTCGSSDPGWPLSQSSYRGRSVTDGTVTWIDDGEMYAERYDIRGAIREVYLRKAALVAGQVDISSGNEKATLSQRHQHFLRLANRYGRVWVP
jgi:hypothetical protein